MRIINLIIILFTVFHSFSQESETPILNTYTFEEVTELQKTDKRPTLVFIHTSWCKYCFAMKKNTFTNKEVIKLLNSKYYFISFDAESKKPISFNNFNFTYKPTGKKTGTHQLASALTENNTTYPATVFLSPNNTILLRENTFLSSKQLLKRLKTFSN